MSKNIDTASLKSAVKLTVEQAELLRTYNHEKLMIQNALQSALTAAMAVNVEQSLACEIKAQKNFKAVLDELGLDPLATNFTADLNDVNNAYFVDADELQELLTKADDAAIV